MNEDLGQVGKNKEAEGYEVHSLPCKSTSNILSCDFMRKTHEKHEKMDLRKSTGYRLYWVRSEVSSESGLVEL